jgi:hypothetical protein
MPNPAEGGDDSLYPGEGLVTWTMGVYAFRVAGKLRHVMGSLLPVGNDNQSVERIGIALTRPVFAHGQLYVALAAARIGPRSEWCWPTRCLGRVERLGTLSTLGHCRRRQRGNE